MNLKLLIFVSCITLVSIPEQASANNLVSYYSAAISTVLVAAGAVILKALHMCYWIFTLSASGFRKKRSTEEEEDPFDVMADTDPDKCYEQLICNLAVRYNEDNVIVEDSIDKKNSTKYAIIPQFLAKGKFDVESPEYDYSIAARFGRSLKEAEGCQRRYTCPLDLTELRSKYL